MKPVELESRLLSSIETEEDLLLCQREGVTAETFVDALDDRVDYGEVFGYIEQHARDNRGALPTAKDLKALFGFVGSGKGDLKTYVKLARRREIGRRAVAYLTLKMTKFDQDDPVDTIAEIAAEFVKLKADTGAIISFLDADALERLDEFDRAKATVKESGIIGIPTGLSTFDKQNLGFKPGELVVVVGGTGVGKSWLLLYMAAVAHKEGYKIFLVSPELSIKSQAKRFDPLRAHLDGVMLSNQDIITGKGKRTTYKDWLEELAKTRRFPGTDRSDTGKLLTFDDVWRFAMEHKPDVLVVDGLHLLSGGAGSNSKKGWEVLKEGIDMLKALAEQEKIVILVAHQPTREASAKGATIPPSLSQIAYGFSVAESADRVISLSYDGDSEIHRLYRVTKLREGKKIPSVRRLYFNVDNGEIHEVPYEDPEAFGTTNEFRG